MKKIILSLLVSLCLVACDQQTIYSHYEPVPVWGWSVDSIVQFDFDIADTLATYQMIINVRHTDLYPYQNMWLFVDSDTIEFYLADDRGRWLGNGRNGYIDMPVLYEEDIQFQHSGAHHMQIVHGMRDEQLSGITDIGLTIRKNGKE